MYHKAGPFSVNYQKYYRVSCWSNCIDIHSENTNKLWERTKNPWDTTKNSWELTKKSWELTNKSW